MCESCGFVHLHVHTDASLLDGISNVDRLAKHVASLKQEAVAITDHGVMYNVADFYRSCTKHGVKPIVGMEGYLSKGDRQSDNTERPYHLLLLADSNNGYRNLSKISTDAHVNGFYRNPRIDRDYLVAHREGLVVTSGCIASEIPSLYLSGNEQYAVEQIQWWNDVFPGKFYLELQHRHNSKDQQRLNKWLVSMSNKYSVPLVATTDAHYIAQDDADYHDTLLAIQMKKLKSDKKRMRFDENTYYITSYDEMSRFFSEVPSALSNTVEIARSVNFTMKNDDGYHLPDYPTPDNMSHQDMLRKLCDDGIRMRYDYITPELQERLEYELRVIHDMGFDKYFLVVWDICEYSRLTGIWWNVRGSGAGSLVAYCLGITAVDPIRNNLIFERFLNPDRVSMPDIDMDFADDRRDDVVKYIVYRYGVDRVSAIVTFGTLGAKQALHDVGRALDMDRSTVDKVAGMVANHSGRYHKLTEYYDDNPDLQKVVNSTPEYQTLYKTASIMQGLKRHTSQHAAGFIIGGDDLVNYVPLTRYNGKNAETSPLRYTTQFHMGELENMGLLKIDVLGLATLTVMKQACDYIYENHGVRYTVDSIPYYHTGNKEQDDRLDGAFDLISEGKTAGVFQLESAGITNAMTVMQPSTFENIVAGVALFRPGPMQFIPQYNQRLHGKETVEYKHPKLEPILKETFGIIVYQEQIIQIARDVFGFSGGEADLIRRAIAKSKKEELSKYEKLFVERGPQNGISETVSKQIWDDILFFAGYGFNKCLVGDTKVIMSDGRILTIGEIVDQKIQGNVFSLDTESLKLTNSAIVGWFNNGKKPVYKLTTKSGKTITATSNHPFFTVDGWKPLSELFAGDFVATPRNIDVNTNQTIPEHELVVLGNLLAEGGLTHPHGLYYTTGEERQAERYINNLKKFDNINPTVYRRRKTIEVYSARKNTKDPSGILQWVDKIGLRREKSVSKIIPESVFLLNNDNIAILLAAMWDGDGSITLFTNKNNNVTPNIFYATSSVVMARQISHLLLRFGILNTLTKKSFKYQGGTKFGYTVRVLLSQDNVILFLNQIGKYITSEQKLRAVQQLIECYKTQINDRSSLDIIPQSAVKYLANSTITKEGLTWHAIRNKKIISTRSLGIKNHEDLRNGFRRSTVNKLSKIINSEELLKLSSSDIYWDKIVSIEYVGEEETYDISVEGTHNFVANDIFAHNSHSVDYAKITVQTAFLKRHYTMEYMLALLQTYAMSDRLSAQMLACKEVGINLLPPSIQKSDYTFRIEGNNAIRFGLTQIKGVGDGPASAFLNVRPNGGFSSFADMARVVNLKSINRTALENMILADVFSELIDTQTFLDYFDDIRKWSDKNQDSATNTGQTMLFSAPKDKVIPFNKMQAVRTILYDNIVKVQKEKDLLGVYVTSRPSDRFTDYFAKIGVSTVDALKDNIDNVVDTETRVGGVVTRAKIQMTKGKTQTEMAFVDVECASPSAQILQTTVFHKVWSKYRDVLKEGDVVVVSGKLNDYNGLKMMVDEIVILHDK